MSKEKNLSKVSNESQLTRGQRLWERFRDKRSEGKASLARSKLLTASYKETEGLPIPIRRAKAFERIVTEIPIYIDDEQLLVGDFSSRPMWAEWYPEFSSDWVMKDIDQLIGNGAIEGEINEIKEICEYWKTRSVAGAFVATLTDNEARRFSEVNEDGSYLFDALALLDRPNGYHVLDYEKPIKQGFLGIIAEAEKELRETKHLDDKSFQKMNFLQSLIIAYKAGIRYASRYAALARKLARDANRQRRQELEKIADVCEWVPANPARSFYEAVQTMWLTHVLIYLEQRSGGVAPGRADQYLYPFYKNDIDQGKLTKEEAIGLLECFRVKMGGLRHFNTKALIEGTSGEAQFHNVVLGGQTPDGGDATNELSYLFLEAAFRTRSPHPTLSVRMHNRLSRSFALKAAEICSLGLGYPAFFNDNSNMAVLMNMGASLEEARSYALGGCVVPMVPGKSSGVQHFGFDMAKALEITLHDGLDPFSGKQIGLKTGKFQDFSSYEEFLDAYKQQVKELSHEGAVHFNRQQAFKESMVPAVFQAGLCHGCIKNGSSPTSSTPRFQYLYHNIRGQIDVVDSLAAIKKRVFEDGSVSKQELIEALDANFEGKEDIRKTLLSAPKFGNDDNYVDRIARDLFHWWQKMVTEELDSVYGHKYLPAAYSVSQHHSHGKRVKALPSGRLAGLSLADGGVSPAQGVDMKGPTAVINSAGKIDQYPILGNLLNMKFQPAMLKTTEDLEKLLSLIKTYFDYGGKHIQFNVVDRETLIDAQVHPERHRNLLVRVAGYSALFIELDRGVQDEVILRTTHEL